MGGECMKPRNIVEPVKLNGHETGIHKDSDQLLFIHSSLSRNAKLKSLFDKNSKNPEEVVMRMMMVRETLKVDGNSVTFDVMAKVPIRVWVVWNAKEVIHAPSNLTIRLSDVGSCQKYEFMRHDKLYTEKIETYKGKGSYSKERTRLMIILEELETVESVFLIYYFSYESATSFKLVKEKFDWCGLSFAVEQIYGSSHGQMNSMQMETCSVCLEKYANTIIVPCRHMCVCYECGKILIKANNEVCPICRKPYTNLIAYYRSK